MKLFNPMAGVAFAAAAALAQIAAITGVVTDPDAGAVKVALVEARNTATGATVRAATSVRGEYRLELAAGTYDIAVPMPCCQYGSSAQSNVVVKAGESRRLDIHLPWGANLGAIADDPILLSNEFRERAPVPSGPVPGTAEGKPDLSGIWINVYNPDTPPPPLKPWAAELLRRRSKTIRRIIPARTACLPTRHPSHVPSPTNSFRRRSSLWCCMNRILQEFARSFWTDEVTRPT